MPPRIPPPWLDFLRDVDRVLGRSIEVHCLGGFVLGVLYDLPRPTGDVDFVEIAPSEAAEELLRIAGDGSEIAEKYDLRFRAFEVHDLALAKLGRNSARDRADVEVLARKGVIDRRVLEERFEEELRPYVLNEARHVAALRLWLDEFFEPKSGSNH